MTIRPQRLQLSRAKGFNLQEASRAVNGLDAVKVDRSTDFGNPWPVEGVKEWLDCGNGEARETSIRWFREWLTAPASEEGLGEVERHDKLIARLPELRGKNLACWCPPAAPYMTFVCHADVLLELANG